MPAAPQRAAAFAWDAEVQPGDRFEVHVATAPADSGRLVLPDGLAEGGPEVRRIEDSRGTPVPFTRTTGDTLLLSDVGRLVPAGPGGARASRPATVWLEYAGEGRWRLLADGAPATAAHAAPHHRVDASSGAAHDATEIEFDPEDERLFAGLAGDASPGGASAAELELSLRAARLATHAGFDRLLCLPMVRDMELLDHQVRTAVTVLRRLRGRAMLCDEVGLGKTIEAGLILSELLTRGLVRSVLVLTPPSLIEQWQGEMRRKFSVELVSHDDPAFRGRGAGAWADAERVIASIHTAKREPHRSAILARPWDMVIVDEAHHLRNRATQAWKFAGELRKQFILLLTATPVQNDLEELFNLVTLLEPGLLSTRRDFVRRFVDRGAGRGARGGAAGRGGDGIAPKNVDELHGLLGEVMVRNRRSTVGLQFTRRWARTERVAMSAAERELYDAVAALVRRGLRRPPRGEPGPGAKPAAETSAGHAALPRMTMLLLQMALGSSSQAAASVLGNVLEKPSLPAADRGELSRLWDAARAQTGSGKADRLLGLLEEFHDKLVVFTQFRATQQMLEGRLRNAGHDVAVFHGGLSRMEKEAAVGRFREDARVLLCTEAGSEGRNLQFAHGVCNFDLPWNPMKIEQRIGRLSRIGQKSDVHVFNLVAAGTVEAAVLHLLEAKLNMFELVIGEVDMILGNLDEEKEFQEVVADEWAESSGADEFAARMEVLGNRLLAAKAAYFRQRAQDEKLFGSRFAPEG